MNNQTGIKLNVAKLLEKRRMSQSELARQSGIRRATVHMYCHQTAMYIQLSHIAGLCQVLQCEINELFEIVEPNKKD